MTTVREPAIRQVGWVFLALGAQAFGGLGATFALLRRELVERRSWLEPRDLAEALAFTKPLPGSTVVQVVAFLGWRLRRWTGALVATGAFLILPTGLMTAAAIATAALPQVDVVRGALTGLHVTVIGLLVATTWSLVRSEVQTPALRLVLLVAFLAGFWMNAAVLVLGAGACGALLLRGRPRDV